MTDTFEPINVGDIVTGTTVEPATTVGEYFGRLVDALFNRPIEVDTSDQTFTKTDIRQMYKRAYPKAKV